MTGFAGERHLPDPAIGPRLAMFVAISLYQCVIVGLLLRTGWSVRWAGVHVDWAFLTGPFVAALFLGLSKPVWYRLERVKIVVGGDGGIDAANAAGPGSAQHRVIMAPRFLLERCGAIVLGAAAVSATIMVLWIDAERGSSALSFIPREHRIAVGWLKFFGAYSITGLIALLGIPLVTRMSAGMRRPSTLWDLVFVSHDEITTGGTVLHPLFDEAARLQNLLDGRRSHLVTVAELTCKSDRARAMNVLLLCMIVGLILSTAVFIVFAGSITNLDASRNSAALKSEVRALENDLMRMSDPSDRQQLARRFEEQDMKSLEALQRLRDEVYRISYLGSAAIQGSASGPSSGAGHGDRVSSAFLATTVTRFGVLAVVLFLVQVLVTLYRYNALLQSQYGDQIAALLLSNGDESLFKDLLSSLRTTASFGKPSMTIAEKLVGSAADAATAGAAKKSPDK